MVDEKLILQPSHKELAAILEEYEAGKPLTSEQSRFLQRYHAKMSVAGFDPVLQYYKITHGLGYQHDHFSFLFTKQKIEAETLNKLKGLLEAVLCKTKERFVVKFTSEQIEEIKALSLPEIMFFHGNQIVTGAPFIPGGVPHIQYFQWGNMLGIIKYVYVTGEKAMAGNVHVYFENLQERNLVQAIQEYQREIQPSPQVQPTAADILPLLTPTLEPRP